MVTILLLAGGRARRFGSDKRLALVAGEPLAARAYRVAASVAPTWVLVADAADEALLAPLMPGARFVIDPVAGAGPLAAIAAALGTVPTPAAVVVAADMVNIDAALLGRLARASATGTAVVVPADDGTLQVACAGYPRTFAASAQEAVAAGERSLTGWVAQLRVGDAGFVHVLPPETWRTWTSVAQPFRNANVPSDLDDS